MNNEPKSELENLANLEMEERHSREGQNKKSQADVLLQFCKSIELFHSPDRVAFASIERNGHREVMALQGTDFKNWLRERYLRETGRAPGDNAVKEVAQTLIAKALFDGEKHSVYLRAAHLEDKVYIDLGNCSWQVVEISASGFRILDESPVKFRRINGMQPLPIPESTLPPAAAINLLRQFVNVESEDDFKLLVGWLISTLGTPGPYLVLVLYGEQGTAKSTTVKVLRNLADPNYSPLRRPPKKTEELMIMAKGNYIVAMDNMSYLPEWLSDDLCILSTGGGLTKRVLYTDDEELIMDEKRAVIANGIDEFVARGDLANRCVFLNLPLIRSDARRSEKEFSKAFKEAQASIFGALLVAIGQGLRNRETIIQTNNPRMVDAWLFISAAETALGWPQGTCLRAFENNQSKANEVVLNSSPLYPFIEEYSHIGFAGTFQQLLEKIKNDSRNAGSYFDLRQLPANPKVLSDRMRRLAPALRSVGIKVTDAEKTSGSNSKRVMTINRVEDRDASDACVAEHIELASPTGFSLTQLPSFPRPFK